MKNTIRKCTSLLTSAVATLSMSVMASVGYFSSVIPDSFAADSSVVFNISSMPYVASETVPTYKNSSKASTLSQSEKTLKLFGVIPIKNVNVTGVTAPIVMSGGDPFGIKLEADGAVVVGINNVSGRCPAKECGLQVGDVILSAAGKQILTNQDLASVISDSNGKPTELTIMRGSEKKSLTLTPELYCGCYKAGIDIRDSSAGIGTMTFYDTASGMFAGLGHAVCDCDTGEAFPCGKGSIADVEITGFRKSCNGEPGELQGFFTNLAPLGDIVKNCDRGVYGNAEIIPSTSKPYTLGFRQEISKGQATMICTIDGGAPKEYSIEIESVDLNGEGEKDMIIHVTDETLIAQTGGIIQGMSGSPIIQNGKLVGAVTHVFVKDTCRGYAIFADKMYETLCSCNTESESTYQSAG